MSIRLAMMGFISFMATLTTYNATMMGISRMIYNLAEVKLLPRIFTRVHGKFRTPWVAIVITFFVQLIFAIVVTITQNFQIPMLMATIIQGMVYALSGAAIWKLRNETVRSKFFWFRGSPYVALVSMLIFAYLAFIVILPSLNASVGFTLAAVSFLTLLYILIFPSRTTYDPRESRYEQ